MSSVSERPRMAPKVAWYPINNMASPGSRLRAFMPCEYLREVGWDAHICNAQTAEDYDIVVFQKVYTEKSIPLARRLAAQGKKLVLDLCDNHFTNPSGREDIEKRREYMEEMIELSDIISASTTEVAKLIHNKRTVVIDDPIDYPHSSRFARFRGELAKSWRHVTAGRLGIVWHGTAGLEAPPCGIIDIQRIFPELMKLNVRHPIALTVISSGREFYDKYIHSVPFPTRYVQWELESFEPIFRSHDICIIPVSMNPFTICKTNNRLVTSLLFDVPVIADEIPSYSEFKDFCLFGAWEESLLRYAESKALRRQHVEVGQAYIKGKYTKQRVVEQWSSLFSMLWEEKSNAVSEVAASIA